MKNFRRQIAVIGGRKAEREVLQAAEEVGALIAEQEWQLICGGMRGVMRSACLGASNAGGLTIGILPGKNRNSANHYVRVVVATGIGVARNSIIAHSADAAIAIGGNYGTLSEIAYFLQLNKPVITLMSQWDINGVISAKEPKDAISKLKGVLNIPA
ncbi:TIGR00725 family protein [bacterium]|nr:TIGR00725 family protein [bacterium]